MYTMCEFVKHGMDNVLLRVKRVRGPSGPETKQDLLAHVDIQSYEIWTIGKELGEYRKPPPILSHDGLDA
jgi:hypothetical protein